MVKLHSYDHDNGSLFYYMDEQARLTNVTDISPSSYSSLVTHLSAVVPRDSNRKSLLLARGFLVWASGALAARNQRLGQPLSQLFLSFCECAGIECVKITGHVRGAGYQVGDERGSSFTWNAFRSPGNTWHLLNPHWCVQSLLGSDAGGRVELEADGKAELKEISASSGTMVSFFNEDWFCVDPEIFLLTHLPDDPQWQLRSGNKDPVTYEEWIRMPYLETIFFKLNLRLLSEESCRLKTNRGRCTIVLSGDKATFKNLSFSYFISMRSSDAKNLNQSNLPRIVVPERIENNALFKYSISCPATGVYFMEIFSYETNSDDFRECCEFMIECEEPDQNCRKAPVDTGVIGYGYGPAAAEAGLKKPSETGSTVVIENVTGSDELRDAVDEKTISFRVDVDAVSEFEYGSCLCQDENEEKEEVRTTLDLARRELSVHVPRDRPAGPSALALNKRKKNSRERFEPVLYYLLASEQDAEDEAESEELASKVRDKRKEDKLEEKTLRNARLKKRIEEKNAALSRLQPNISRKYRFS